MNNLLDLSKTNVIWITSMHNIKYLTGFDGSTAECIINDNKITLITDGRYKTHASKVVYDNIDVYIIQMGETYNSAVEKYLEVNKPVLIEGEHVSAVRYKELSDKFKEIKLSNNLIEEIRYIKTDKELDLIKKAVEITDKTFLYLVNNIKVGMTELEVKNMLDQKHLELGADGPSFEAIVASGVNSSKPHARASKKVIEDGDILTLDFGCFYKGYCSDMTRTFFVGEPKNEKLIKIHDIVFEAHKRQISALKPGAVLEDIDKIGRDYITKMGYGEYFNHGTGHGIGLEIHEGPVVSKNQKGVLKENMVITIEPGIYVEGIGGCRIENDCVITKDGCIELNTSIREHDVFNK